VSNISHRIGAAGALAIGGELQVHRIGLGGAELARCRDDEAAARLLRRALELGVDLIDTADVYGDGLSELRIARALHPYPAGLAIATKGGFGAPGADGKRAPDGRPEHLRSACLGSLRRLRVETIALYQLHTPNSDVPLAESLGALAELRAEGKVRHIGVSNVSAEQFEVARAAVPVASVQNGYNVIRRRRRGPDPALAACERAGIPYLAWQPLAAGRLAHVDEATRLVAARHGAEPSQVALAWLLQSSAVTLPIPGTTSIGHLEENVGAAGLRLSGEDLALLERPAGEGS
jgi:aryl-alcohol dehydrogenase-like predicted oxidoreductase